MADYPVGAARYVAKPSERRFRFGTSMLAQVRSGLIAEYGRAVAAARRYDELRRGGSVASRPVEGAIIPRAIFEEFYGGAAPFWRP